MIDILQACKIAKEYFLQNTSKKEISKIYEMESSWIIFGKGEEVEYGGSGIIIDKKSAEAKLFILPSLENFAILENASKHDVPKQSI